MVRNSPLLPDQIGAAPDRAAPADAAGTGGTSVDGPSTRTQPAVARPADLTDTVASIVEELKPMFNGLLAVAAITDCATRAVQDLLGSICLQALPEMAVRLAAVRLQTVLPPMDRDLVAAPTAGGDTERRSD